MTYENMNSFIPLCLLVILLNGCPLIGLGNPEQFFSIGFPPAPAFMEIIFLVLQKFLAEYQG